MAGGAGQGGAADHAVGQLQQGVHLRLAEGPVGLIGGQVGLQLLQVGHAGQGDHHLRQGLQEAEGPGGDRLVGAHGLQGGGLFLAEPGQPPAPQGLHHPDGDAVLLQQGHLLPVVLEGPVHVVQLQLAELHILSVGGQEALQYRKLPVAGEAQVPDAAVSLLLHEIVIDAVPGVQIGVDVHLAHVVEEIEVEVVHPALLQLLLEDLPHPGHVGQVVAGELVRQIEAVPGVFGQRPAHHQLGVAVVIAIGGVVVVDPVGHGVVHHGLGGGLVDAGVVPVQDGQAHAAHA